MITGTITLQFWGILPTAPTARLTLSEMYHYITVLGHPSNRGAGTSSPARKVPLHYSSGASFQRESKIGSSIPKSTITLQFWGILPTAEEKARIAFQPERTITLQFWGILPTLPTSWWKTSRIVPLHYSSGASFQQNSFTMIEKLESTITLQFWGILPTPYVLKT